MELPINTFKRALRAQRHQTGLWVTLGHPNSTELVAASGFDWLLLDTEAQACTYMRAEYDIAGAQAAIRAARLPDSLAERLQYGQ